MHLKTAARAVGGQITLHAYDAGKMAAGMPIRYLGIDIGQIQSLELITAKNEVQAKAVLYPEYVGTFARAGTRFSVITPQISAAGVEHLDTLFQAYINVEPGRGPARRDFEIRDTTISDSRYIDGLNIVVEAPEAGSLGIGTPVLFRGLEVGTVTGLSLGSMSDRVMVKLRISKRYQYLVRNNSVFWLASGYSLDFGLIGGVVKTGTFNQFIRGGIAFATPPGTAAGAEGPGWQALPATGERAERVAGVGHRSAAVMPLLPPPGNAGRGERINRTPRCHAPGRLC